MIIRTTRGVKEALALTPVIREFKLRYPNERILIETTQADIFENNPFVDEAGEILSEGGIVTNLDMYSALQANCHIMDLYARIILGDTRIMNRQMQVFLTDEERAYGKSIVAGMTNVAAICFDEEDSDSGVFSDLIQEMGGWDYEMAFIDELALSLRHSLAVIENCEIYVGLDMDISYMAMCSSVPMVMGMSFRNPKYIYPFRRGVPFIPIVAEHDRCPLVETCEEKNGKFSFGFFCGVNCPRDEKFACAEHEVLDFTNAIAEATME